jgi:CheY-like chemotaxis protein
VTSKGRILVVDDERSMQEFLEIFFRREGFEVVTAADVDSALLAIDADDFDLVISDVQMPERNGLEVLRAVKETSPETIVIMITAFANTETWSSRRRWKRRTSPARTGGFGRSCAASWGSATSSETARPWSACWSSSVGSRTRRRTC